MYYSEEKANHVINFIQQLKLTKGKWAGKPFKLLPWEIDLIKKTFGTLREDGTRQYRTVYVEIGKKNGKALAIDTPIASPDGWATMEKLKIGDKVFDENGKVCNVVATTEIMHDRPCYELTFSDGSKITADAEHQWQTNSYFPKYETHILTTEEIYKDTIKMKTGYTHRIPNQEALELLERELTIPPYVLGVWLADGNSHNASFTCNVNDVGIMKKVVGCGVELREWRSSNAGSIHLAFGDGDRTQAARDESWQAKMREMNLLKNKHIPVEYLRASVKQRKELLKGLMDSDGYVSKEGQCEYTTVSKRLAEDVAELIRSLGFKCSTIEGRSTLYGKDLGPKYRIHFYAYRSNPVFSLSRKNGRLKEDPDKPTRNSFRTIVEVKKVESVPVKCIQVDSPSRLYLAGKSMVPTHNSEIAAAIALYMLLADGESNAEVYVAACDRQQASIIFNTSVNFVEGNRTLSKVTKTVNSVKRIVYPRTGSFFQVLSSDVKSKSGLNVSCVILDEIWTYPNPDLAKMLTTGSGDAREEPLFIYLTTAGNKLSGYGWDMHNKAKDVLSGKRIDDTFLPIIYGLEEDDDWEDEANWYKANPSLGHTIQIDMVPFQIVDEYGEIQEIDNPKFTPVSYKLIKRAGYLPITNELLRDTDQNILAYITNWIAKKHVVTKNGLILSVLNSLPNKDLKDINAIKKVLNVDLDPAFSLSSSIITNQDGFQWLDEQEDINGRPLLQEDITQPGKKIFKGRPIVVVANRTLPSTGSTTVKAPFIVGNFKELMVLFNKGTYELASTNIGGDAWRRDTTELRTITRDDCVKWDETAAVFGKLTISTGA